MSTKQRKVGKSASVVPIAALVLALVEVVLATAERNKKSPPITRRAFFMHYCAGLKLSFKDTARLKTKCSGEESLLSAQK